MSHFSSRAVMPLVATCTALLLLSGCSGGDQGKKDDAQSQSDGGESSGDTSTVSNDVKVTRTIELYPDLAIGSSGDAGDTSSPDATAAPATPDGSKNTVSVGFAGLAVKGKVAVLTLTFTPNFAATATADPISLYDMFDGQAVEPNLIDAENLKSYAVASEKTGGKLGPNPYSSKVNNHQTMTAVYVFAAPTVDKVDVYLGGRLAFDSVAVTR